MISLTSPDAVLSTHPGAAHLDVCDGRERIGLVLDTRSKRPRSPRAPSYAFDPQGRFIGEFPSRKVAVAAVSVRDAFERGKVA